MIETTPSYCREMPTEKQIIDSASLWLDSAFASTDGDVLLTSPYLSADVCSRIAKAATTSAHAWKVITRLDPRSVANGYLSVQGLHKLLSAGVALEDSARLHAKCFIVGSKAMLGSANLTGSGLGAVMNSNLELGVELDADQLRAATQVISSWPTRAVDTDDLVKLLERAKRLTGDEYSPSAELDRDAVVQLSEMLLRDARDPKRTLWVKAENGEPALDGWRKDSWFASPKKGRPQFSEGDLVVMYAKGTSDCYAVVEVQSEAEFHAPDYVEWVASRKPEDLEQYPWINRTRPRFVPSRLVNLTAKELEIDTRGLQNGHIRLTFDQFTATVRGLARLNAG
jgi:hypothetical protein